MGSVALDLLALLQRCKQTHQHRVGIHEREFVGRVSVAERCADLGDEVGVAVDGLGVDDDVCARLRQHFVRHLSADAGTALHQHLDAERGEFPDRVRGGCNAGLARDDFLRNPDPHTRIDSACPGAAPQCPARCGLPRPGKRVLTEG